MDRRKFSLSLMGSVMLAGCGGEDPAAPAELPAPPVLPEPVLPPPGPELATPTALPARTVFAQTVANTDGEFTASPGQANVWDLNKDFSIIDGGNDQFDGAMRLRIEVAGTEKGFFESSPGPTLASLPLDESRDLTALGPEMDAADGLKFVSFTRQPIGSNETPSSAYAFFHGGSELRLEQTLDLSATTGPDITIEWDGEFISLGEISEPTAYIQVVVRDLDGTLLQTIFRVATNGSSAGDWGAGLLDSAHAGKKVVLSFEQNRSSLCAWVSNIRITGPGVPANVVTNGNFEAGDAGWRVVTAKASQNVRSAEELLLGLQVQRSFFTQPNQLWGRLTDTFHNPSAAPISATISYASNLGSDVLGVIYHPTGSQNKALSSFDTDLEDKDRDCGFVFGSADTVEFTSATADEPGMEDLFFKFNISVAPGQTVTLVNFVLLSGDRTFSETAKDYTARATKIDAVAVDIVANFRTNFAYQRGLTQQQLDTLKNF